MYRPAAVGAWLSAALMLTAACGGGGAGTKSGGTYTIKFASGGTNLPEPNARSIDYFGKRVKEYSNGSISVKPYYGSVLGTAPQTLALAQAGTIQMDFDNVSDLSSYVPNFNFLQLPLVFNSKEQFFKGLASKPIQDLSDQLRAKSGLRILDWQGLGFVQLLNRKHPISSPADIKGLRIRIIPGSQPLNDSMKLLGAQPVPLDFSEVYTGESQGTLDGNEEPLTVFQGDKEYEVAKYLTILNFQYNPAPIMINDRFYSSLPPDLQQAVTKAAADTQKYELDLLEKQTTQALDAFKAAGVKVVTLTDSQRQAFVSAVAPATVKAYAKYGADLFHAFDIPNPG